MAKDNPTPPSGLPLYDAQEQGVSDDVSHRPATTIERQDRRDRNAVDRKRLIERLNNREQAVGGVSDTSPQLDGPESHQIWRVVIYLRVSTEEQASVGGEDEGYSIPYQRDACLAKARAMNAIVVREYVEAGESAKSANRPKLQQMLRELKAQRIDYVIVHKIDRLARNRADDVEINATIAQAGAKLISVAEPVDDTPAGRLLYNMMADVAQYHSDNLAVEVLKGMDKKAQLGGTPYRTPLGYLNKTELVDGARVSWVEVDPERGPLVRWLLEEYATGDWTVRQLADAAEVKGLQSRGTRKSPPRPVVIQSIHRMLHNPYYFGVVPYRGVYYEGKHEPLISVDTWLRIQEVLTAHNVAGEKTRKYPHYLKGTIFCGECGTRLVYSRNRGRGGVYEYFICLSRKTKRRYCSRTVTRLDKIEVGIAEFYRRFQVGPERVAAIRQAVQSEIGAERADAEATQVRARKRLEAVNGEREKLLQAYYAGVVPPDLLKTEMDRLTRELANAEQQLQAAAKTLVDLDSTLDQALMVAGNCGREYLTARPKVRRQINQGLFMKLYIGRDGGVERYDPTEPFGQLLDQEWGVTAADEVTEVALPEPRQAGETPDGRMRPSNVLTATFGLGSTSNQPNGKAVRLGLHNEHLVPPAGHHAEGWRPDQGILTGRLVIEGTFPVDPPGGDA